MTKWVLQSQNLVIQNDKEYIFKLEKENALYKKAFDEACKRLADYYSKDRIPRCITNGNATYFCSDQVSVRYDGSYDKGKTFTIKVCGEQEKVIPFSKTGSIEAFKYKGERYLLNLTRFIYDDPEVFVCKREP